MRPKLLFNLDSRSPNCLLPGLTAILLLNVTTFLTAFSIVREKERGTLEQLFVTPVRPMGLLFGKLLPYLPIGFSELCLILTFMPFIFQVPIHATVFFLPFLSFSFPLAFHRHSGFQQSQLAVRSHPTFLSHFSPQHFLFGLHLSARNHAHCLLRHQLFHSRQLLHQHHPRHHPPRRRTHSSLARWPSPLCHGLHSSPHSRPPLPEQSHHGLSVSSRNHWPLTGENRLKHVFSLERSQGFS